MEVSYETEDENGLPVIVPAEKSRVFQAVFEGIGGNAPNAGNMHFSVENIDGPKGSYIPISMRVKAPNVDQYCIEWVDGETHYDLEQNEDGYWYLKGGSTKIATVVGEQISTNPLRHKFTVHYYNKDSIQQKRTKTFIFDPQNGLTAQVQLQTEETILAGKKLNLVCLSRAKLGHDGSSVVPNSGTVDFPFLNVPDIWTTRTKVSLCKIFLPTKHGGKWTITVTDTGSSTGTPKVSLHGSPNRKVRGNGLKAVFKKADRWLIGNFNNTTGSSKHELVIEKTGEKDDTKIFKKPGWYIIRIEDMESYTVKNTFVQEFIHTNRPNTTDDNIPWTYHYWPDADVTDGPLLRLEGHTGKSHTTHFMEEVDRRARYGIYFPDPIPTPQQIPRSWGLCGSGAVASIYYKQPKPKTAGAAWMSTQYPNDDAEFFVMAWVRSMHGRRNKTVETSIGNVKRQTYFPTRFEPNEEITEEYKVYQCSGPGHSHKFLPNKKGTAGEEDTDKFAFKFARALRDAIYHQRSYLVADIERRYNTQEYNSMTSMPRVDAEDKWFQAIYGVEIKLAEAPDDYQLEKKEEPWTTVYFRTKITANDDKFPSVNAVREQYAQYVLTYDDGEIMTSKKHCDFIKYSENEGFAGKRRFIPGAMRKAYIYKPMLIAQGKAGKGA